MLLKDEAIITKKLILKHLPCFKHVPGKKQARKKNGQESFLTLGFGQRDNPSQHQDKAQR